eukprot:gnl/TRDRNA2_/TRDRNA2_188013_c0_seq1.p1 gnl/TRDRNA2_/TRDRNA2_188013_c0~~gnl/TRDRNA2_/TRDRNA2_188013_c0_seq1.p1  ORF type:complete len:185 (+),score=26.84 gnl/TRDRNA2_/TRDRNA2_188013_c0_seq1:44-556(+)
MGGQVSAQSNSSSGPGVGSAVMFQDTSALSCTAQEESMPLQQILSPRSLLPAARQVATVALEGRSSAIDSCCRCGDRAQASVARPGKEKRRGAASKRLVPTVPGPDGQDSTGAFSHATSIEKADEPRSDTPRGSTSWDEQLHIPSEAAPRGQRMSRHEKWQARMAMGIPR